MAGRHILRLMPTDLPGVQRRISGLLTIAPEPAERHQFQDFFGNSGVEVVFREAHAEIDFRLSARVERLGPPPSLDISPELARLADEIAGYRGLDPEAPHHFLGPSPRTAPAPDMTSLSR